MRVTPGSTDVSTYFVLRTAADGTATTGATITDIDLQYCRSGAEPAAKVDATALAATDSAHGDNQAIEIDATDQPGLYRVDWPDAAFAAGVREVTLSVKLASSFTEHLRVELTPVESNLVEMGGVVQSATDLKDFADEGYDPATNKVQGVVLADTCTTNTDMVGTDSAALASVCTEGRLAELDAANLPSDVDDVLADTGELQTNQGAWATAAGFALASVCTEGRLAELDAGNLPSDVDDVLADTGELQTNQGAWATATGFALASVCTEARLAELDAANLPADIDAILADTNELQTDDVPGLIAALNDLSNAQAEAACDAAFATYDPPTKAEMDAVHVTTDALIAALNDLSAADVNAEVVDALATDTYAEPGQGTPAATASLAAKLGYLYKMLRNKKTTTATALNLFNDDASTVDQKATLSDDGTTFTQTELETGP